MVGGTTTDEVRQNAALVADEVPDELWARLEADGLLPAPSLTRGLAERSV